MRLHYDIRSSFQSPPLTVRVAAMRTQWRRLSLRRLASPERRKAGESKPVAALPGGVGGHHAHVVPTGQDVQFTATADRTEACGWGLGDVEGHWQNSLLADSVGRR